MIHYHLRKAIPKQSKISEDESACSPRSTFRLPAFFSRKAELLVVGDDLRSIAQQLDGELSGCMLRVHFAGTGNVCLDHVRTYSPDVVILDLTLLDQSGLDVYQQIRSIDSRVPVIFVSSFAKANAVIEAIKRGAYDCLLRPLHMPTVRRVVHEALDTSRSLRQSDVAREDFPEPEPDCEIIGFCPAMGEVYKAIGRVAAQDAPVLITGESGTGKELVARAIYQHGPRADKPFLALNCAAIPENLLESELFGHEKGAFTGADRRRIGKFEQCNGGTILLDEIGDMPLSLQAKILRLLQNQTFERVGGSETIRTDVRVIAATHRDLKAWTAGGKFRPDLYYRLGVFTIHLPPLRERADDLPLLVRHYVQRFSGELRRQVRQVAPETMLRLCNYSWPGNIRELQSVLKQALLLASGGVLLPAFLPKVLREPQVEAPPSSEANQTDIETFAIRQRLGSDVRDLYAETHRNVDRLLLPRVMERTRGNQQQAALLLGIARQTLRVKLRDLGLYGARLGEPEKDDPVNERPV
jgi:two-component system nitrogen regulation response regulator GlnG